MKGVPKIIGSDVELGNFISGLHSPSGSGAVAARVLLSAIEGIPAARHNGRASRPAYNAQDRGRRFLPGNGGCAYIDSDHLELATPETWSAFDYVTYWQAMLHIARQAVDEVNARVPDGVQVHALANCSDGHGHSYGAHLNVLVTRAAWDKIVRRKPHYLACLAAFQVSSIVFTGAGKVGSENGRPWAGFQISQRADFLESVVSEQTMFNRPIVNARDEALCGSTFEAGVHGAGEPGLARLHVIFFDATLCQVATLLRAGTMQIVTALLEADEAPTHLALDDPLEALQTWSRDPTLGARTRLAWGEPVTAVELQQRFLDRAREFAAAGGLEGIVPRYAELLDLWADTLTKLAARDFDALARRLDWVLKQQILSRALALRPSLTWSSPEIQHLDQLYASIDDTEGLFRACELAGQVDEVVSRAAIDRAVDEPPDDTRAWARAHLLRRAGAARVTRVDWDRVALQLDTGPRGHERSWVVHLPCPYGSTSRDVGPLGSELAIRELVESMQVQG
jgi:proteasome accessory factor A